MKMILSQEERDRLIGSLLNEPQASFMTEHIRRGKRTAFARELARGKGVHVTESMTDEEIEMFVDDWVLLDFIDAGPGYAAKGHKCECGRVLRYVYVVSHKQTEQRVQLGKDHFEEHTRIPASIVKRILQGMEAIDYELDELLLKLHDGWSLSKALPRLPDDFGLPTELERQLSLGLPLLDRQIEKLRYLLRRRDDVIRHRPEQHLPYEPVQQLEQEAVPVPNEPEGPVQFEFDFDLDPKPSPDPEPQRTMKITSKPSSVVPPDASGHAAAIEIDLSILRTYINEGIQSARAIAELLITRNGYADMRYVTGKPRLYPYLCMQLDRLTASGAVELIGVDSSHEDRTYRLV